MPRFDRFLVQPGPAARGALRHFEISGIVPANFDPDNIIKPIIDLLVHNRVIIDDDKRVDHTSVDRIAATMPDEATHLGSLHVRVWEYRP